MKMSLKKWVILAAWVALHAVPAQAAQLLSEDTMDQVNDQSQGGYQPMDLGYAGFNSLGMFQSAWQDPLNNLGEGQSKPAYSKYYWTPDLVLPVRVRQGMKTLINFPEWELVESVYLGDTTGFSVADGDVGPNYVMVQPNGGTVGVDTNMIVFGRSGNRYVFYVRSEGVNTERLTNSIIDIDVVEGAGASGGRPSSSGSVGGFGSGLTRGTSIQKQANGRYSTYTQRFLKEDWLKSIPMDPAKFRFDIEIYVPNPDDVVIAPERVWRDDIFTYIDLGEKALNMVQRPVVSLIVERTETPVGFRSKGPNNRLIVIEGVGDMVMRSGKRMVCLKLRRADDEGLQYVDYAEDGDAWDIGPKHPNGKAANGGSSENKQGEGNSENQPAKNDNVPGGYGTLDSKGGLSLGSGVGFAGDLADSTMSPSSMNGGEMRNVNSQGICTTGVICNDLDYSKMNRIDRSYSGNMKNAMAQYKYGSGFTNPAGDSISIELGTDANVHNLEALWKDLSAKYPTLLGKYEPFYSVDAPADGQGKELFHLRVGPVQSLDNGDAVCSQLGRGGVFCSVVRVQ